MVGNGEIPPEVKVGSGERTEDHLTGARSEVFNIGDSAVTSTAGDATTGASIVTAFADSSAFGGEAAKQALKNFKGMLGDEEYALLEMAMEEPDKVKALLAAGGKQNA